MRIIKVRLEPALGQVCEFFGALDPLLDVLDTDGATILYRISACNAEADVVIKTDGTYFACAQNYYGQALDEQYRLVVVVTQAMCGDGMAQSAEQCDIFDFATASCREVDIDTFGLLGPCSDTCMLDAAGCQDIVFTQTEPDNDTTGGGDAFVVGYAGKIENSFAANFDPVAGVDCIRFSAAAGANLHIAAGGFGDGACADFALDPAIEVFDTDGTTVLGEDANSGEASCALLELAIADAGDYFVCVGSFLPFDEPFAYQVVIDVL